MKSEPSSECLFAAAKIGGGAFNNSGSEWEDNVVFDEDDPDFPSGGGGGGGPVLLNARHQGAVATATTVLNSVLFKVPSTMSMASLRTPSAAHLAELCSSLGRTSMSMSSSISDLVGSPLEISADNIVTIEDLRAQMGSCFTCGVSWTEDHVSLDCTECGGYSMERPCPLCDGKCGNFWKRDFTMSHACRKAKWMGSCPQTSTNSLPVSSKPTSSTNLVGMNSAKTACGATSQILANELCARLEKLSSQT